MVLGTERDLRDGSVGESEWLQERVPGSVRGFVTRVSDNAVTWTHILQGCPCQAGADACACKPITSESALNCDGALMKCGQ
jgi:hypothetical protein